MSLLIVSQRSRLVLTCHVSVLQGTAKASEYKSVVLAGCLQLIPCHPLALLVLVWSVHILFKRKITLHQWDRPSANIKEPVSANLALPLFQLSYL